MRLFLLMISTLLFTLQANAQDFKWYIKNSVHLNAPGTYYTGTLAPIERCYILGVSHPDLAVDGRNDLFIIYGNGNHFNSRELERAEWIDHGPSGNSDYYVEVSSSMTHLYFTNIYEDDEEPNAFIKVVTPPAGNSYIKHNIGYLNSGAFSSPTTTNPSQAISSNHTAVAGKDITLIIANDSLSSDCKYDLCFNLTPRGEKPGTLPPSRANITGSNIFTDSASNNTYIAMGGGSSGTLVPAFNSIRDGCVTGLTFNSAFSYTYVNLHIPEFLNSENPITFSLKNSNENNSCPEVESLQDTIRDSHDPNYVQLKCVQTFDKKEKSTIKYKAYCMNDGFYQQPNPSIEFTFPYNISLSDITMTRAKIRNSVILSGFNTSMPVLSPDPSIPNRVKFEFSGSLDNCTPPSVNAECEAWVEFCVKVHPDSVNVLVDNLEPYDRNTNFGSTLYPINTYYGLPCIKSKEPIDDKDPNDPDLPKDSIDLIKKTKDGLASSQNQNHPSDFDPNEDNNFTWKCLRKSTSCNCKPNFPRCYWYTIICNNTINWVLIGCIILLLILLFLTLRFLTKSKR